MNIYNILFAMEKLISGITYSLFEYTRKYIYYSRVLGAPVIDDKIDENVFKEQLD